MTSMGKKKSISVTEKSLFVRNVIKITMSRGLSLLSSVAIGFIIPIALGVTGYGYYKIFTLYSSYLILLHFGFVDGVLLRFAGDSYDQLNFQEMRSYTTFYVRFQAILAVFLILLSCILFEDEQRFIGVALGVNMFLLNVTAYYQYLSQAVQRFSELSFRNVLSAALKLLSALLFLFAYLHNKQVVSYRLYIIVVNSILAVLLAWYVHTYREITFGSRCSIKQVKNGIGELFKTGIKLTIAGEVAHLVLILDRQFVSALYSTNTYAIYAFAYSIVTIFTALISESAKVLFPMLRTVNQEEAMKYFSPAISVVSLITGAALVGYFPMIWFVNRFMPDYVSSLLYIRIILPSLILSCSISIVMFTFYKVLDKNTTYFYTGCLALVVGVVTNVGAHVIFHTPVSISWASVLTMFVWYFAAMRYFVTSQNVKWKKNSAFIVVVMLFFYIVSALHRSLILAGVIYVVGYCCISLLFFGAALKNTDKFSVLRAKSSEKNK